MNLIETQKGIRFDFQDNKIFFLICGQHNKNLCAIEQVLNISIDSFGNQITINGKKENVEIAVELIRKLHDKIKNKENKLGEVQKSDIENIYLHWLNSWNIWYNYRNNLRTYNNN